jgi:hypothetical protein
VKKRGREAHRSPTVHAGYSYQWRSAQVYYSREQRAPMVIPTVINLPPLLLTGGGWSITGSGRRLDTLRGRVFRGRVDIRRGGSHLSRIPIAVVRRYCSVSTESFALVIQKSKLGQLGRGGDGSTAASHYQTSKPRVRYRCISNPRTRLQRNISTLSE